MGKETKLKLLQQQVIEIQMQQQRRIDCVTELQAEAEQVSTNIHLVHVEVKKVVNRIVVDVLEHLNSEIFVRVSKVKEDVQRQTKDVTKIFQDFQAKLNTTKVFV